MTSTNDKYCYPNTNILINKFGFTDTAKVIELEMRLTISRLYQLQRKPIKGNFDFAHLKSIHKHYCPGKANGNRLFS